MIALLGLLAVVVAADWRSAATIAVHDRDGGFVRVVLDDRIDAGSNGDYDDVRVFDDRGALVPFVLESARSGIRTPVRQAPALVAGDPQRWVWDLQGAVTSGDVRLVAGGGTFERPVIVEYSADATTWWAAANATVERYGDGSERLAVAFSPRSARYWRVTIDNGDDAPVSGLRPVLMMRPRAIVFEAESQRRYHLAFSNPDAAQPRFDLAERLAHQRWRAGTGEITSVVQASAGPIASVAPLRRPPAGNLPQPTRADALATAILVDACRVLAVVLGAVAVRALRVR